MVIRELTRSELVILKRAFHYWGVFDYFKDKAIVLDLDDSKKKKKSVCVSTKEIEATTTIATTDATNNEITHLGLEIGELHKKFVPSLAGADLFVRIGCNGTHCVSVDDVAEALVLYGRDVMGESVIQCPQGIVENDVVVILNQIGQAIGVGRTRFSSAGLRQKGKVTITTLDDAGRYLREEGN
jgi:ribosome biogenesis protein Nip4